MSAPLVWQEVACLPDCAFAALGDPSLLGNRNWLDNLPLPRFQVGQSGLGLVYGLAECDGLPVEVGYLEDRVVAARLKFTNDVVTLERDGEGWWARLGELRIETQGVVALDAKHEGRSEWLHHVALPAGCYRAEAFQSDGDHLGVRLIVVEVP